MFKVGDRVSIRYGAYALTEGTVTEYKYYPPEQYVCNTTVLMDATGNVCNTTVLMDATGTEGLFAERELMHIKKPLQG